MCLRLLGAIAWMIALQSCIQYRYTALPPDVDVIARQVSPHTFRMARSQGGTGALCSSGGPVNLCFDGGRTTLEAGADLVLAHLLTRPPASQEAEYVAGFDEAALTTEFHPRDTGIVLTWRFALRDRAGAVVIAVHGTESLPTNNMDASPALYARLESAVWRRIDTAVATSSLMTP